MTSSIAQKIPERVDWFLAAFITAAVIALHFFFWRQAGALWRDEINTVNLAQSDSLAAMTRDSFPVLMPLLVKIWSHFSVADISLRFLGLLMGLLIPAAYLAVARVTRRPPLISLTLFGLSPVMICYGDSLRAYGIGSALIVFAVWAVWWFLKSPDWKRALILALVATLSVQALYQNALLFFSVCLGAFSVCARRRNFQAAWKIFCAGLLAAASLLPYFQQFTEMPHATEVFRRGFSLAGLSASFGQAVGFPYPQFIAVWCVLILAAICMALFGFRKRSTGDISLQGDLKLFAGVTLVSSLVLFVGFLWYASVGTRAWYFIPPLALAAICIDLALPLGSLPRLFRVTALGLVAGLAVMSALQSSANLHGQLTNVDRVAKLVEAKSLPEDFIVVTPWYYGLPFARYYHGAAPWQTLPPIEDHSIHRVDLVLKQMENTNCLVPVFDQIAATLRAGHRVWVVGEMDLPAPGAAAPPVLPPPPLPGYGYSGVPYLVSWPARVAYFLSEHSAHFDSEQLPVAVIPGFQEDFQLFSAEGWRK